MDQCYSCIPKQLIIYICYDEQKIETIEVKEERNKCAELEEKVGKDPSRVFHGRAEMRNHPSRVPMGKIYADERKKTAYAMATKSCAPQSYPS